MAKLFLIKKNLLKLCLLINKTSHTLFKMSSYLDFKFALKVVCYKIFVYTFIKSNF